MKCSIYLFIAGILFRPFMLMAGDSPRIVVTNGLLFYASFDQGVSADIALGDPRAEGKEIKLTEGRFGQGVSFAKGTGTVSLAWHALKNINPAAGTVAFYFKPGWAGTNYQQRMLFSFPGRDTGGGINSTDTLVLVTFRYQKPQQELWAWLGDGGANVAKADINAWQKGAWHHVAFSWTQGKMLICVDGEKQGFGPNNCGMSRPGEWFFLGTGKNGISPSDGIVDELYIYDRPLAIAEIQMLTGRPEYMAPRINSLTMMQTLYFLGEAPIRFQCELAGLIDPEKMCLQAELVDKTGAPVMAPRPGCGCFAIEAVRNKKPGRIKMAPASGRYTLYPQKLPAGTYFLRLRLTDKNEKLLDEKSTVIRFVKGPF